MGSNTPNDDWKNFEPRKNAPSAIAPQADKSPLSAEEITALSTMSDAEVREYGKKLSYRILIEIMANPETPAAVRKACATELLDRAEGKPVGSGNQITIGSAKPMQISIVLVKPGDVVKESITVIEN